VNDVARELRARLSDPRALCEALGLGVDRRDRQLQGAGGVTVRCPRHGGVSLSVTRGPDGTARFRCFGGCDDFTGDALDLVAAVHNLDDFRDVLRVAADLANAPALAEVTPKPPEAHEGASDATYHSVWSWLLEALSPLRAVAPHVAGYLDGRRIGADAEAVGVRGLPRDGRELVASLLATFERADLERAGVLREGQDALDRATWPLCIPWLDRFGHVHCVQRRRIDQAGRPKYLSPKGRSPRAPFGVDLLAEALDLLGPSAEIIITEGAFAALARRKIARHGDERAVVLGVYSASTAAVGMPMDLLEGRRVVLSLDRDGAGESAREKLVALLEPVAGEIVHERTRGAAVDAGDVLEAAS
jgi:DNA primase